MLKPSPPSCCGKQRSETYVCAEAWRNSDRTKRSISSLSASRICLRGALPLATSRMYLPRVGADTPISFYSMCNQFEAPVSTAGAFFVTTTPWLRPRTLAAKGKVSPPGITWQIQPDQMVDTRKLIIYWR